MKVWHSWSKKLNGAMKKKGALGCLGDLLGMMNYPVECRDYFINHEMDFLFKKDVLGSRGSPFGW